MPARRASGVNKNGASPAHSGAREARRIALFMAACMNGRSTAAGQPNDVRRDAAIPAAASELPVFLPGFSAESLEELGDVGGGCGVRTAHARVCCGRWCYPGDEPFNYNSRAKTCVSLPTRRPVTCSNSKDARVATASPLDIDETAGAAESPPCCSFPSRSILSGQCTANACGMRVNSAHFSFLGIFESPGTYGAVSD